MPLHPKDNTITALCARGGIVLVSSKVPFVLGELFKVDSVLPDRIRVDHVWRGDDADGLLMYKMVLSSRQKFTLG